MTYLVTRKNSPVDFRSDLDGLFEGFFSPVRRFSGETNPAWAPAYDIAEEDDHYLLSLEMPGVPKDDIKIEVAENMISVSGERKNAKFMRSFSIPPGADSAKIEADYRDGILQLVVPKAESVKPRQIKIGGESGFFGKLYGKDKEKIA